MCINKFTLVNDLSAAQFVTINVDLTVTLDDVMTRVVISRPIDPVGRGDSGRACAGVLLLIRFIL